MTNPQIWVGNLPYDTTEEELRSIFSQAGPLLSVRIRYDRETGQSKGFGFCDYQDLETCAIAVKRLSGMQLRGRTIRVDWSTPDLKQRYQGSTGQVPTTHGITSSLNSSRGGGSRGVPFGASNNYVSDEKGAGDETFSVVASSHQYTAAQGASTSERPDAFGPAEQSKTAAAAPLYQKQFHSSKNDTVAAAAANGSESTATHPHQAALPSPERQRLVGPAHQMAANLSGSAAPASSVASILQIVESLTAAQLLYVLGHMQKLVLQAPDEARNILLENPQLTYALLHAQLICGMIDEPFIPISEKDQARVKAVRRSNIVELQNWYERHWRHLRKVQKQLRHDASSAL